MQQPQQSRRIQKDPPSPPEFYDQIYEEVMAQAAELKKRYKLKPWECEACYNRRIDYIMSNHT